MRLSVHTDYGLRMLMRLAMSDERLVTIETIATEFRISRNHLMKVAHSLGRLGYIKTVRGRSGGLQLGRSPSSIRLGDVVAALEPDLALVECFQPDKSLCCIGPACKLRGILGNALAEFIASLNKHSLAELVSRPKELRALLDA